MRFRSLFVSLVATVIVGACAGPVAAAQWWKADLHVHSAFSADAYPDLGIISNSAKAAGFNAIFLTDHNLASNFPISGMTANHMFFEDTLRRWTQSSTGTLSSSTNALASSPVHSGTQSLHLAAGSSTAGETFVWTKRGPLLRSSHAIVKFSVNAKQLTGASGVYVSASIGGDPTVKGTDAPSNNPIGYTTQAGVISPGKSNVLVWYFGSPPPSSFYGTARVVTHQLSSSNCDKSFALNTWVTCTIDVTAAAQADIPAADQPVDYNGFSDLKLAAVANGGSADAYFDSYTIDATSDSATEFVYRNSLIHTYDTSTFKIFPSLEMGTNEHAQRFNFGITNTSQFVAYPNGIDGIGPTEATGYPAQLNHPGEDGGVTDQQAIDTNAEGAELMEVRIPSGGSHHMIDDWDAILRKGVPLVGTWGGDNHIGRWTTGSQATKIWADTVDFDSLITALRQGRAFMTAGVSSMAFNLDGSSTPYPAATPVVVPTSQSSQTVQLSITGGITSGDTVRWLSNNGSTTTTSVLATDTISGTTYAGAKSVPLSGTSTYVRAEVYRGSTLRGMTEAILFKRSAAGDTQAPSKPTGLTAAPAGTDAIQLSWTASTDNVGVTGYKIYRDGGSTPVGTAAGTTFQDTGLAAGSTHTYTVSAVDAAGNESTKSDPATATTDAGGGGGGGGIGLVREATGSGTSTSTAVTVPITANAGDALVATVAVAAGSSKSVSSVTDPSGGSWTKGPVAFVSGSNSRIEEWFRTSVPSGVSSVTVTLSAAVASSVNVSEWSGVASAGALDGSATTANSGATNALTGSVSTTSANDLLIGAINYSGSTTSTLNATGFTSLSNFSSGTSTNGRAAYQVVSAAGSYQAAWSLSAAANSGGAILALKAAAASPPPPPPPTDNPPSVSVTAPLASSTVSGAHVTLAADATDDNGDPSVQFKIDGTAVGAPVVTPASGTHSYQLDWDSTSVANGTHTVSAVATDSANQKTTSAAVSFTVSNSTGSSGSIQLVHQATAGESSLASLTVPLASNASGNTLVATFALATGSSKSISTVTDSSNTAWTRAAYGFQSGSNTRVEIWYRLNAPAGITNVTATFSAAVTATANVSEWSGVAGIDGSSAAGNASGTVATTPSLTTGNANDVVIGAINYSGSATSTLGTSGFTAMQDFTQGTTNGRGAYRFTTATGAYQASWNLSAAATSGGAIIALTGS